VVDGDGDGAKKATEAGSGPVLRAGKSQPYRRKQTHDSSKEDISRRVTAAILSLTLSLLLGTPILAIVMVLFGAPFTTHHSQTALCAAHFAILSSTGLVYVHGVDNSVWREIWAFARPADAVWGGAFGTGVGAWLGAIPIPLDWDRPWQAYPITIITGAYIGYVLGSLVAQSPLLYGKRIEFKPEHELEQR
jgi:phosphatidylinositol glycan class F